MNTFVRKKDGALMFVLSAVSITYGEKMVDLDVETSNRLFEILTDWNTALERAGYAERLREISSQVPPCP